MTVPTFLSPRCVPPAPSWLQGHPKGTAASTGPGPNLPSCPVWRQPWPAPGERHQPAVPLRNLEAFDTSPPGPPWPDEQISPHLIASVALDCVQHFASSLPHLNPNHCPSSLDHNGLLSGLPTSSLTCLWPFFHVAAALRTDSALFFFLMA